MSHYSKNYDGFFNGSLREEAPYTRLLFMAMYHTCDENGIAIGTPKRWADFVGSKCTIKDIEIGLAILSAPDSESTSSAEEGRRIVPYGDGKNQWRVVNHHIYYAKSREEDRKAYKADWIRRDRAQKRAAKTGVDNVDKVDPNLTELNLTQLKEELESGVALVMSYFNQLTDHDLAAEGGESGGMRARLRAGATVDDLILVIDYKFAEWATNARMSRHVNPTTLFRPTKFARYLSDAKKWDADGRPSISDEETMAQREKRLMGEPK